MSSSQRRRTTPAPEAEESPDQEPTSGSPKPSRGKASATAEPEAAAPQARVLPRLLIRYREEILPLLLQEFHYENIMEVPHLQKVGINTGLGEALDNPRALEATTQDLVQITGQQPMVTRARQSIANFKLRAGQPIGLMVTLRGDRMYLFVDKLLNTALPRIRDFRGVSRASFDGRGNYSLGIREQIIFPEIDYNQIDRIRGLQVNIITTARSDREAARLLELLGMPFTREVEAVEAR